MNNKACLVGFIVLGCLQACGSDPPRLDWGVPVDGLDAGAPGTPSEPAAPSDSDAGVDGLTPMLPNGQCTPDRKPCNGACASLKDPLFGCGSTRCDRCPATMGTPICVAGTCAVRAASACDGIRCDQPPAAACADATSVRESIAPGACAASTGTCSYSLKTVACPSGQLCNQGKCVPAATSCQAIHAATPSEPSGPYMIDPDGAGPVAAFKVYCDMENDGGGWTLALKADGALSTFAYAAAGWTDTSLLNVTSTDLSPSEAKFQSFNTMAFTSLRVTIATSAASNALVIAATGTSLGAMFSGGTQATAAGRAGWMALVPGSALQANCNMEGVNVVYSGYAGARIGILGNDGNDCAMPDSFLGIGTFGGLCNSGTISVGNKAGCGPLLDGAGKDTSDKVVAGFGYVFLR